MAVVTGSPSFMTSQAGSKLSIYHEDKSSSYNSSSTTISAPSGNANEYVSTGYLNKWETT